jgi:hypothetical protein
MPVTPMLLQEAGVTTVSGTRTEVFWTCHLHALSTEVEEVMGLLLGDVLVRAAAPRCLMAVLISQSLHTERLTVFNTS